MLDEGDMPVQLLDQRFGDGRLAGARSAGDPHNHGKIRRGLGTGRHARRRYLSPTRLRRRRISSYTPSVKVVDAGAETPLSSTWARPGLDAATGTGSGSMASGPMTP